MNISDQITFQELPPGLIDALPEMADWQAEFAKYTGSFNLRTEGPFIYVQYFEKKPNLIYRIYANEKDRRLAMFNLIERKIQSYFGEATDMAVGLGIIEEFGRLNEYRSLSIDRSLRHQLPFEELGYTSESNTTFRKSLPETQSSIPDNLFRGY